MGIILALLFHAFPFQTYPSQQQTRLYYLSSNKEDDDPARI